MLAMLSLSPAPAHRPPCYPPHSRTEATLYVFRAAYMFLYPYSRMLQFSQIAQLLSTLDDESKQSFLQYVMHELAPTAPSPMEAVRQFKSSPHISAEYCC